MTLADLAVGDSFRLYERYPDGCNMPRLQSRMRGQKAFNFRDELCMHDQYDTYCIVMDAAGVLAFMWPGMRIETEDNS